MNLMSFLRRWFTIPRTKEEMIQRYRRLAAGQAIASLVLLLVYFTVPAWASDANADTISMFLLAAAGMLAAIAVSTFWAASLIRRNLFY